jgi:sulfur carrier protein ThiS
MVKLTLPSPLLTLVPADERSQRSTMLEARSWADAIAEIRTRFPQLAARVLTESGGVIPTFALVVNDDLVPSGSVPPELSAGDEIALIAIMAGG